MTILLISILGLTLTFFLYRHNLFFALIRVLAILFFTGMLANFHINIKTKDRRSPIALIDVSASTMPFAAQMESALKELDPQPDRLYFAESVYNDPSDPAIKGNATNIIYALRSALVRNPSSIILISDGNHNFGPASLSDIDDIGVPVHCYAIGFDQIKDQGIIRTIHPRYAFPGDSVTIEVITTSQGFDVGEQGRISLFANSHESHHQFKLSNVPAQQSTFFNLPIKTDGEYKLTFNLTPKHDEVNNANNQFQTAIKVIARRLKVLYFTDHLSFTWRFLSPILQHDDRIELTAIIKLTNNTYFDPINNQDRSMLPSLKEYDVCIFDNINTAQLPWQNLSDILNQGTSIIFMGLIESPVQSITKILPVKISNVVITNIKTIQINTYFLKWNPGDELPPFQAINRVNGIHEKAIVVASAENIPVIAYLPYGSSIVFQINGANPGALHFLEQGIKQKGFLADLIPEVIRFVASTGRNRRLLLSTTDLTYRVGDMINFDLQSFDRDFRLSRGGDFYLEYRDKRIPFYESGPGNYQASIIADSAGSSHFQARGFLNDENMSSNAVKLNIVASPGESAESINYLLLETIARQTKGEYHSLDSLKYINNTVIDRARIQRLGLDNPLFYFLIFGLLAIEWYLRRRRGTI